MGMTVVGLDYGYGGLVGGDEVKGGTLCSGEVVYELDNYSGGFDRGPACGLGDFVPVEYADKVSDAPMIMGE